MKEDAIGKNVLFFKPKRELDAETNLNDFINFCKNDLNSSEIGINWELAHWEKIFTFTKINLRGIKSRYIRDEEKLDKNFIDFAKSYVLYNYLLNSGKINKLTFTGVIRSLENKLMQINENSNIRYLNITVLNECIECFKERYSKEVAYKCGCELQKTVIFLNEHGLLNVGFLSWSNPLKAPEADNVISKKADLNRLKKLPDERSINAIGEIFSLPDSSLSDNDMFITSVFALLMCAPSRVSEILALPADCEVIELDRHGKERYGLRFYSLKGFGGNVKWIPDIMVPVAKKAIRRLLNLSKNARELASSLEESDTEYRQSNQLPKSFPWYDKEKRIKYSNALCCLNKHQLSVVKRTSSVLFKPNAVIVVRNLGFSEYARKNSIKNIFEKHGYLDEKGNPLFLKTHQARHLINTIAQRGGLGDLDIAKWSGRVMTAQNRVYNHITEDEMLEKAKNLNIVNNISTPCTLDEISQNLPSELKDISLLPHGAVHITEFGYCIHDYIISPCNKFGDCIHCDEQVCIKGEKDKLDRLKERYLATELLHSRSVDSMSKDELGADKWFLSQDETLKRLKELISLMEDINIHDGSAIKLNDSGFSHLKRILNNNKERFINDKDNLIKNKLKGIFYG
ncbi:integrase [Pectobacterium brasiliense]|uniref:integrase n=1 Tax=Pectobacterium brasiliense TaxID=180957 RepID=UPI003EBC7B04